MNTSREIQKDDDSGSTADGIDQESLTVARVTETVFHSFLLMRSINSTGDLSRKDITSERRTSASKTEIGAKIFQTKQLTHHRRNEGETTTITKTKGDDTKEEHFLRGIGKVKLSERHEESCNGEEIRSNQLGREAVREITKHHSTRRVAHREHRGQCILLLSGSTESVVDVSEVGDCHNATSNHDEETKVEEPEIQLHCSLDKVRIIRHGHRETSPCGGSLDQSSLRRRRRRGRGRSDLVVINNFGGIQFLCLALFFISRRQTGKKTRLLMVGKMGIVLSIPSETGLIRKDDIDKKEEKHQKTHNKLSHVSTVVLFVEGGETNIESNGESKDVREVDSVVKCELGGRKNIEVSLTLGDDVQEDRRHDGHTWDTDGEEEEQTVGGRRGGGRGRGETMRQMRKQQEKRKWRKR